MPPAQRPRGVVVKVRGGASRSRSALSKGSWIFPCLSCSFTASLRQEISQVCCWRVGRGEALWFPVCFSGGSEVERLAQGESCDSRRREVPEAEKPVGPTPAFPASLWGWTALQSPCSGTILTHSPTPGRPGEVFASDTPPGARLPSGPLAKVSRVLGHGNSIRPIGDAVPGQT